jgi:hypothetical protein
VNLDLPAIEVVWKKPDKYGLRINIGPVLDKDLTLWQIMSAGET